LVRRERRHFFDRLPFAIGFFFVGVNGFGGVLSALPIPRMKRSSAPGSSSIFGLSLDLADMVIAPDGQNDTGIKLLITVGRGTAIQNYAALEHTLCMLMANLMGTSVQISSVIFFRIINTRSRNKILDDLMKLRTTGYEEYWKSLLKLIRKVDSTRNEIVHWTAVTNINPPSISMTLRPPDFWNRDSATELGIADLQEFSDKCNFINRSLAMFNVVVFNQGGTGHGPWFEIFRQQAVYPPPSTHPLFQKPPTP
jgi:hypothetical protein